MKTSNLKPHGNGKLGFARSRAFLDQLNNDQFLKRGGFYSMELDNHSMLPLPLIPEINQILSSGSYAFRINSR
jgi:hypothetical protein